MFWGHADHPTPVVMTFPSSPTADLLKITPDQLADRVAQLLEERKKVNVICRNCAANWPPGQARQPLGM